MNQKPAAQSTYHLFSIILLLSLLVSSFGATKVLTVQAQANEGRPAQILDSTNIIATSKFVSGLARTFPMPAEEFQLLYGADCLPSAYGYNQDSTFFSDVLGFMSIPVTQFALDAFAHWKPYENTAACWNPLATTLAASSIGDSSCTATIFNSANVRNYSSKVCGEKATAITLLYTPSGSGTYYKPIREMLSQQSFNWQAIHDALIHWIGSDAYSTSLANEWQTLWNSKGGGGSCPGPSLISPADGYVSLGQAISFSWSAIIGCGQDYTFRIKDTFNMDSGGAIVDGINYVLGGTSSSQTISSQWNNRDLYWGVRAANAPNGANWSVRRFRIEPRGCPSVSGVVRLFAGQNCSTPSIDAGLGLIQLEQNNFNDSAESIAIPSGWSARLYLHNSETGPSACFSSTDTNLSDNTFSDGTNVANQTTWMYVYNNSSCSGVTPLLTLNLGSILKNRLVTIELRYPLSDPLLPPPFMWTPTSDANGKITNFPLQGTSTGTAYTLLVKPHGWLRMQRSINLISSSSVDFAPSFTIYSGGDINDNNKVDILDFQILSNEFGTTNLQADLDGDGAVNIIDFQILSNGFGKQGEGGEIFTTGPAVALAAASDAPGKLTLVPSTNTPKVGDVITVNLEYDTATLAMAALDAMIDYDQCVLEPITNQIVHSGIFATTATISTPGTLEYEAHKWTGINPGSPVSGSGLVASIPFKVIGSVPSSTNLSIRFRSGSTYLSNLAQDDIVHPFLGSIGNTVVYPTGIPQRPLQSAQIVSPSSGAIINQNLVFIETQISDPCNGIHQVSFSVFYDGQWRPVATDKDGTDGWAVYWDASIVTDQVIKVKAFAGDFAGNGVESTVNENILLDRSSKVEDTTGVFRPGNGLLYLKNKNETGFADRALNYGLGGDYPVVGDWNGDGDATIGIYRNGSFYLRNSNSIGFADLVFAFGQPGDQPIAGDWNNDGVDTIGVYRPSNGLFLLRNSNSAGSADLSFYLGNVGDVGVAGDWDGDGVDTTGVFRPSNGIIFLKNTNSTGFADIALNYGIPGDKPITGDWNNDGVDTIGVYRNGIFYLRNSNTVGFADIVFGLGIPGDMPVAGNWDGMP